MFVDQLSRKSEVTPVCVAIVIVKTIIFLSLRVALLLPGV